MVPMRHRRCAISRERKSVSGVVPTLSQPILSFNLCWHNTGSVLQICPLLAPCCPQFKDEGGKISSSRQSTCPEPFSSQWVKHSVRFLNQSTPSRLNSKLVCPVGPLSTSLLPDWSLLHSLNTPSFLPQGSALAVLFIPHFSITPSFRCQPKVPSQRTFPAWPLFLSLIFPGKVQRHDRGTTKYLVAPETSTPHTQQLILLSPRTRAYLPRVAPNSSPQATLLT